LYDLRLGGVAELRSAAPSPLSPRAQTACGQSKVALWSLLKGSVLCHSDCALRLQASFEEFGSGHPLNTFEKLRLIAALVRGEGDLGYWLITGLQHLLKSGLIEARFPATALAKAKNNDPGFCEQILYVKAVVNYIFTWMQTSNDSTMLVYNPEHVQCVIEKMSSFPDYAQCYEDEQQDLSWQGNFPKSLTMATELLSSFYKWNFKAQVRYNLRMKTEVVDFMTAATEVQDKWKAIVKQRKEPREGAFF
jgi:hypothetical protein